MNKEGMLIYDKNALVKIIHRHLPGCKIILFGLKLKDTEDAEMEVSVALDAKFGIDTAVIGNIYDDIKNELPDVDVDIVDLEDVSQEFKDKILEKGVIIHAER
jgi:hypothetical protein